MTTIDRMNALPNPFIGMEAAKPKANRHGYNPVAVNQAIEANNRRGKRIGPKEAKAIHGLLKGRSK